MKADEFVAVFYKLIHNDCVLSLNRDFYDYFFKTDDAAFVIAVARDAGTACHLVAVGSVENAVSGAKADDDKDGREDKDDDADDDDGDKMVEAARMHPKFRLPRPDNAKLETDYWTNVAMPFYVRHFVDAFVPPAGMSEKDAKRVKDVRRALARYLATGRDEFPTGTECAEASALWRAKCRDAAVAIVHYIGLEADPKYWQGNGVIRDAVAKHDFKREPVLGFVLRAYAFKSAAYHIKRKKDEPRKPLEDARVEYEKAFGLVVGIYKSADRRILERFADIQRLPPGALKAFGDEYLTLCQTAQDYMDKAFDARGSGWASSVTEEGWKGWGDYNAMAASNLLAAVRGEAASGGASRGDDALQSCRTFLCGRRRSAFMGHDVRLEFAGLQRGDD